MSLSWCKIQAGNRISLSNDIMERYKIKQGDILVIKCCSNGIVITKGDWVNKFLAGLETELEDFLGLLFKKNKNN